MALAFEDQDDADSIAVGILNTVELDIDNIAVIAVDDLTKPLKVVVTKGAESQTFEYNLSGLTLAPQG